MPFVSPKQRGAMYAAAAGKGTIGIPQEAAQRFIAHSQDSRNELRDLKPKKTAMQDALTDYARRMTNG